MSFLKSNFLAKPKGLWGVFVLKLAKKVSIFFLVISGIFMIGQLVLAEDNLDMSNIFIPAGTVYDNILFTAGENVNINAQMKDDVYVAGANVVLSGLVEGDVIAAGANIEIDSEVKGDVRVVGASVTIKGNINGNVTVLAGELTIDDNAQISKNLLFAGGNLKINGKIYKNLYAAGGNIILNNDILGSAYIAVDPDGMLTLYPKTNIGGDLQYTAKQRADIKQGAQIQKQEKFNQFQPKAEGKSNVFKVWFGIAWFIGLLGSIVVGLVVISVFKDFTLKIQKVLGQNIGLLLLKGFIFLIVTPIALLILAITIIGLPLAIISFALYLIMIYAGKIFVGLYLGNKVIKLFRKELKETPMIWAMILGLVILHLLFVLPVIGFLVKLFVCLFGLGALITILKKELNFTF